MESIKDLVDRLNGENYSRVERSPLSQRRGGGGGGYGAPIAYKSDGDARWCSLSRLGV